MEVDTAISSSGEKARDSILPEIELYLNLLVLVYLHDSKQYEKVCPREEPIIHELAH